MTSYSAAGTAYALLQGEAIELARDLTPLLPTERDEVAQVLRQRYHRNAAALPGPAPEFHHAAAVYGFECFVAAAHEWYAPPGDLLSSGATAGKEGADDTAAGAAAAAEPPAPLLPRYLGQRSDVGFSASEMISADLCLGYLTTLRAQIKSRYLDDLLVEAIETTLAPWPYTALLLPEPPAPALDAWWAHPTLRRLYVDRLIERSHLALTVAPQIANAVETALGTYAAQLWPAYADAQKQRTSPA